MAAVQARLAERALDGIIVADPANLYYLTGYNAWSFYTPQIMHVPVEGEPHVFMRAMDANGAHRTALQFTDRVEGYPESFIHKPDCHPGEWMADRLRELGVADGAPKRVAVEDDAHFFTVRTFRSLQQRLPEWELVSSDELVNWVRVVKSAAEIDAMRHAGKIVDHAMTVAIEEIRAGRPLNEIVAEVQRAQARGVDGSDGDYPAIVPMFPRGEGADTPHLTWTREPIGEREGVSIEIAGAYHRYHAPLARCVSVGAPSQDLDRLAKVTLEGFYSALEALRPGNTAGDVTRAWDRVLREHGFEKKSRLGYSIGIGFPPDWGERTVSLRAEDETVLQENMTFHMIAGMWMTGYGFECSESLRVTEQGAECFTSVPRDLVIKAS